MVYVASPPLMAKIRSLFPIRNATRVPFHDCTTLHCTVCIHLSRKPNELEWPCTYIYIFIWRRKHSVQLLYLLIGRCPSIIVGLLLLLLVALLLYCHHCPPIYPPIAIWSGYHEKEVFHSFMVSSGVFVSIASHVLICVSVCRRGQSRVEGDIIIYERNPRINIK